MRDDEEIIAAYEAEFDGIGGGPGEPDVPRRRRAGRGFWVVAGALLIGGVLVVSQIFAHKSLKEGIGLAQTTLQSAAARAKAVQQDTGSFIGADHEGLATPGSELTFREADQHSVGSVDVSVSASATTWGGAARATKGVCFYIRLEQGEAPTYGVGTDCRGTAALEAVNPTW